MAYTFPALNF